MCPLYGIAGCPLFRAIGVYGATIRTWVSVCYNGGVRSSGVSVKRSSTVMTLDGLHIDCIHTEEMCFFSDHTDPPKWGLGNYNV